MREIDPNKCIDFILENAGKYADAQKVTEQLELFRPSLKAILMKKSGEQTIGGQEREAAASEEYINNGIAIAEANALAVKLKWELEAAKLRHATWQTLEVSARNQDRIMK
jgi:hypothetical protein